MATEKAETRDRATCGSLLKAVRVACTPDQAFEVFTARIAKWWPATYSIGKSPLSSVIIEPYAGGRWYEIDDDGTECLWGDVLEWEPPHKLILAWRIREDWRYDPELLTEVIVKFDPVSESETLVVVEHRLIENLGDGAAKAIATLDSPRGWTHLLQLFSSAV